MITLEDTINEFLRLKKERRELTGSQLAVALHVSESTARAFLADSRRVAAKVEYVDRLAAFYGFPDIIDFIHYAREEVARMRRTEDDRLDRLRLLGRLRNEFHEDEPHSTSKKRDDEH